MRDVKPCPNQAKMKDLALRPLPDDQAEKLARHLEQCTECATTVENLLRGDTMAEALRQASKSTGAAAVPGAAELVARLRGLWQAPEAATLSGTAAVGQVCNLPGRLQTGPTLAPRHDFLAPPKAPGELGWLGSFRILKELGAGGMGMVFLAEDTKLERMVALKVMRPELAKPEQRQRFLREAKAAAKVQHDHVVTIYQVGEEGDVPFLAMQLLEGESLDDWLKRGQKASPAMICRIGREVAEGLAAAHARGLIHRDIKPGNLWIEGNDERGMMNDERKKKSNVDPHSSFIIHHSSFSRVKILDFGLARATSGQEQLTTPGTIIGTPAFASPEQFRGEAEIRSDIFSLGAVLYRLCTGKNPFRGNDVLSVVASVSLDTPTPIRDINADIPSALANLVKQMLAKEAKDRPASSREIADRLAVIERTLQQPSRSGEPSRTKPPTDATFVHGEPGASATGARRAKTPVAHAPGSPRQRKRALVLAALAACIALILGGVIYVQTDRGTLEIRTSDPNVKVSVERNGEQIDILDPKSRQQLSIRSGQYTLKFIGEPEGLMLSTDQGTKAVTLKRGGKVIVEVSPIPPLPPVAWAKDSLAGDWDGGVDWGRIRLGGGPKRFTGTYSATYNGKPGSIELTHEEDNRFKGEWAESDRRRFGSLSLVLARHGESARIEWKSLGGDRPGEFAGSSIVTRAITGIAGPKAPVGPPLDPAWVKKVQALPPEEQVKEVAAELKRRNPGFDGRMDQGLPPVIENGIVTRVGIRTDSVRDLTPIRAFSGLLGFTCAGSEIGKGSLIDLSPLRGLALRYLNCSANPQLADLSTLADMPLEELACASTAIRDLTPLRGRPLRVLNVAATRVADLSPLKGMSLKDLNCGETLVVDLLPLKGMPLNRLFLHWTKVADVAPLQGIPLEAVDLTGTPVADLSPLKGAPLQRLTCPATLVADLSPLKGMKLTFLSCWGTKVADLSPLEGMPLTNLSCPNTDLSPLKSMPLKSFSCDFKLGPDQATILRSIKTLETIKTPETNDFKPAAEVLAAIPRPFPPLDPAWVKKVQSLPPEEQVKEVATELKRRNPGFDGAVKPAIKNGAVTGVQIMVDHVTDISPVRALAGLKLLDCRGSGIGKGKLTDLSPLRGFPLAWLSCIYTPISDLAPLRGMPLEHLFVQYGAVQDLSPLQGMSLSGLVLNYSPAVSDLTPLRGMPLTALQIMGTKVTDLSPVRGMRLTQLMCSEGTPIRSFEPVKDMPLKTIHLDFNPWRDVDVLRSIKTLEQIDGKSPAEFWKQIDAEGAAFDAWAARVAKLRREEQVKEVAAELKRRNPRFDGKVEPTIADGVVKRLDLVADNIADISPVRALTGLKELSCQGSGLDKGKLADLWPLKGLALTALVCGFNNEISDLSPLKGMPLIHLSINGTKVSDLSPLAGMRLSLLQCTGTGVSDLTALQGMPLKTLTCTGTKVTDLSPLKDMQSLTYIWYEFVAPRDTTILKSIKSLETINGKPAAEFWRTVDSAKSAFPPLDPAWVKKVQSLPPEEQVKEVAAELKRRNPGFDGKVKHELNKDAQVSRLEFSSDAVSDLAPVRALPSLTTLIAGGAGPEKGKLRDLSPLKGMALHSLVCGLSEVADLTPLKGMPISFLNFNFSKVTDLSPLQGMPLGYLGCGATNVLDLTPLKDMPLGFLNCAMTEVSDLSPLRSTPIHTLYCERTNIADLSPLKGKPLALLYCVQTRVSDLSILKNSPLTELWCDFNPYRDSELIKSIKTLKKINGKPAADFWKLHDQERFRFDTWVVRVGFMKPDDQLKEVAAELKKRNPGFDGKFNPVAVNNGVVDSLGFNAAEVTDLSPVRALVGLKSLICANGDPAKRFLDAKLPPAKLADLWPLVGLKLVQLEIRGTQVADLAALKGMPLTNLICDQTRVIDLTPLADLPLKHLTCDFQPARDTAILRGIKSLERINGQPVKEMLK